MRWIHAAGRGLLVLVVVLTGYVAAGAQAGEPPQGGRGPLTLATAGDLTGYLGPLLEGWNRTHPGEKVTLVGLPDSADETQAQMVTDLPDSVRLPLLDLGPGGHQRPPAWRIPCAAPPSRAS